MEIEAKTGRGDDVQPVTGMWEAGGEARAHERQVGGMFRSRPHHDVIEAFMPKRDVNVVQVLPIQAGLFDETAEMCEEETGGRPRI